MSETIASIRKDCFQLGMDQLTASRSIHLSKHPSYSYLSPKSLAQVANARRCIENILASEHVVYGVNTGFGSLCNQIISSGQVNKLQTNILKSHSVGLGRPVSQCTAKLMLLLKIHSLARGNSGVRPETLHRILWHLKNDIIPLVPRQGSVGASGDLAPLAHLFLPLIGLGYVKYEGKVISGIQALKRFNMKPLQLGAKEGLALINGTQFMAAYGVQIVDRLHNCLDHADVIGAMSLEALQGSVKPFHHALHQLRPFPSCRYVAHRMSSLLEHSEIIKSHINWDRVQDPYSLRCIPQVHGASRNAWLHLKDAIEIEINAVTDNPIVLENGETISGGNFHGQPIALPMDYAGLAAAELGNIADRRIYLMLEGKFNGLPKLLMKNTGLNSGFMLPQYTSAALASENKSLCFPASADSIPTSVGQEDHVSMGSISGRKTLKIIKNLEKILAIELLCATQAFDFRRPLRSGPALEACHHLVRNRIAHATNDRLFGQDIHKALKIVRSRELIHLVNQHMGDQDFSDQHQEFALFKDY